MQSHVNLLSIVCVFIFASIANSYYTSIISVRKHLIAYAEVGSGASPDESVSKSKGFGSTKKVEVPTIDTDIGTKTYENQAKRGVPEYNIFLRPANGTEVEWVPVGSMTIPRDTAVSKAVFEVEDELLKGTFKLYPKLKAFYDVRKEKYGVFEYGYCLKAFPDEPIRIIQREAGSGEGKNFFTNWYSLVMYLTVL